MLTEAQIDQARQRARKLMYEIEAERAIGGFMFEKFRKQAVESGLEVAAKNMRKQGVTPRVVAQMWMACK